MQSGERGAARGLATLARLQQQLIAVIMLTIIIAAERRGNVHIVVEEVTTGTPRNDGSGTWVAASCFLPLL